MLRAAVLGAGYISTRRHIPAFLRQRGRVDLAAIVDRDLDAARRAAARFGIPAAYSDPEEMLEREGPDLVDVCTPPATHASLARAALSAGSHVLIEKPMALTVEECDRTIQEAQARGRKVCVAHTDLFYPPFVRARSLVDTGAVGEFRGMRILLSTPTSYMTSREDHWAHRLPGGVIGESGPHAVYMTLAFVNPVLEVEVRGRRLLPYRWSAFDDYRIDLVGEVGTSSIACVCTSDQWAAEVDLWGSRGMLRIDLEAMTLFEHRRPALTPWRLGASVVGNSLARLRETVRAGGSVLTGRHRSTHDRLVGAFVESILEDHPPPVAPQEGREAVRVMNLIAERLQPETLPAPAH